MTHSPGTMHRIVILLAFLLSFSHASKAEEILKFKGFQFSEGSSKALLSIQSGFHIIANESGDEFLIPMEAQLICGDDSLEASYPSYHTEELKSLGTQANWFTGLIILEFPHCKTKLASLNVYYQACNDKMCLSPTEKTFTNAPKSKPVPSTKNRAEEIKTESKALSELLVLILFAFIGGLILNIMPCVLPVLGLKIFSLLKTDGSNKTQNKLSGISFVMGILVSFWVICAGLIILQSLGHSVGWGFQFTYPEFVFFVFLLVLVFALNLLGLFEITLSYKANTALDGASKKGGYTGAFFNGVFMTLLSTPCSAPFLGTSMGYALSQPPLILIVFFTAAGLGLAFPFVLVSFFPQWIKFLPKPGDWMNRFKEVMGFTMLITAVWLLSVMGAQIGLDGAMVILYWSAFISLLLWIWKHWGESFSTPLSKKLILALTLLTTIALSGWYFVKPALDSKPQQSKEAPFALSQVQAITQQGQWVFVDYTADWCISCKVNEKSTINTDKIQAYFSKQSPHFLIGDYTSGNTDIDKELRRVARAGVPLYILYGPNGQEHVFPEVISPDMLIKVFMSKGFSN
jgi:thiol:disulfide interchange protein